MRDTSISEGFVAPTPTSGPAISHMAELRVAPRFAMLLRAAKLVSPVGEFLCVVRDASSTGASVKLFHDLPPGGPVELELPNGDRHPLQVVWRDGDKAGLKFDEEADIARLIEGRSSYARRPIRVNLDVMGLVHVGEQEHPARLLDLSQQGAKLLCRHKLAIDQRLRLSAPGLPEVNAKVRWRRETAFGLVFEDTFQLDDLARITARMQKAA